MKDSLEEKMKKVILITGSGKEGRVGNHLAKRFAEDGYDIVVHYRGSKTDAVDTVKKIKEYGANAIAVQSDLSDENQVKEMFGEIGRHFKSVYGIVHAASLFKMIKMRDTNENDLVDLYKVNSLSGFYLGKYFGPIMKENGEGRIVFFSDAALNSPYPDYDAYLMSKSAVPVITRLFAKEFAPKVLVNAIAPGPIKPPEDMPKEEIEEAAKGTLIKRWIGEEEIYRLAKYLIETKSMTGQILNLDGGKYST